MKTQTWSIQRGVHLKKSPSGLIALSAKAKTLYVCNKSAAHILASLSQGHDEETICAALVNKHGASRENAALAFKEFVDRALRLNLVEAVQ